MDAYEAALRALVLEPCECSEARPPGHSCLSCAAHRILERARSRQSWSPDAKK